MSEKFHRRDFLKFVSAAGIAPALQGCGAFIRPSSPTAPRVAVLGGGFGGATAARYLKLWGGDNIDVTLVERNRTHVSCPQSNLVLGGSMSINMLISGYEGLARHRIRVINDEVNAIDSERNAVRFTRNDTPLQYDHLIVSPGIDFMFEEIPGMQSAAARRIIVPAWKAGNETVDLRRQLEAMPDGGTCIISIPKQPYRCPPGPYERACQIASYFRAHKARSKLLVLDANEEIVSKKNLFLSAWRDLYPGIVDYLPNQEVREVDIGTLTVKTDFDSFRADVINVIPPQRAGNIAAAAGLITANNRWCGVDWQSMRSLVVPNIHVLGDATLSAPAMPKSASMANCHAKIAAAAILASVMGEQIDQEPVITNTCYSYVSDSEAMHVNAVYRYDVVKKTFATVPGSGGLSPARSSAEKNYADAWADNIRADSFG
jgi:sulfide dehydrogenase [flavocytochrome c] flavoprotein subunit